MHSIMQTFILVTIHCIMQIITALHLGQKEKEEQGQLTCLCEGIIKEKKRERERCVCVILVNFILMSQICSVNKKLDRCNINEIKMLVLLFCSGRYFFLTKTV